MSNEDISDQVESWEIENIRPYENNAKIHSEEQVASIAKSIETFGFDQPIVVDGAGVIIKGHGRHLAAQKLGMKRVPVIVRHDLTANQANASRLADNRVAQGDYDTQMLQEELEQIARMDEDLLGAMGFSDKELDFMTNDLGEMDTEALMDTLTDSMEEVVSEALTDSQSVKSKRIPVKEIFGFTHVSGEDAKVLARWVNMIQGDFDTNDPVEALVQVAQGYLDAEETSSPLS